MLSRCFLDCSVGVRVFVTGLSQSSFSLVDGLLVLSLDFISILYFKMYEGCP